MLHRNSILLLTGALCVGCFVQSAVGLPSVKRLGVSNNGNIQTSAKTTQNTSGSVALPGNRIGTVRSLGAGLKSTNTNKLKANTTIKPTTSTNTDTNRLSVGKYIHASGVESGHIKPISSSEPVVQSDDFINLTERVEVLEKAVLPPTDGIELKDGVIGLSEDINQLPTQVSDLSQDVEDLTALVDDKVGFDSLTTNYYSKEEVEQYVQQIVSQISHNDKGYVNTFDSSFLTE